MTDALHLAVLVAVLFLAPGHLPWVLVASTVVYGIAKARQEAHERENGWRRFVVGR